MASKDVLCPPEGDHNGRHYTWTDHDVTTLFDLWELSQHAHEDKEFLGQRPATAMDERQRPKFGNYEWLTYGQIGRLLAEAGSALSSLVAGATKGHMVGIMGANCIPWFITMMSAWRQASILVPLYASFGVPEIKFILGQTELETAVCSYDLLPKLHESVSGCAEGWFLKRVIYFGTEGVAPKAARESAAVLDLFRVHSVQVLSWEEFLKLGVEVRQRERCTPADLSAIVYTSGSSGKPKGAMLTQRSLVATADFVVTCSLFPDGISNEVHYSYLPLSHCFELCCTLAIMRGGGRVGFTCGNIAKLLDDVALLRPTLFVAVPRVLKRLKDAVLEAVTGSGLLSRIVFSWAVASKSYARQTGGETWIDWDRWVLSTVANKLGGRVRFVLCGAAPLDPALGAFVEDCFGVPVFQGYGLTESCAATCIQRFGVSRTHGSIGYPLGQTRIRLVDVPDMSYMSTDNPPRGEIQIRGELVFSGYYKNTTETEQTLLPDGSLATGDIGVLNPDGSLSVIDRKKNIFKMQQGEYISTELIESALLSSGDVSQAWVTGEPTDNFLVAIVVPNLTTFRTKLAAAVPAAAKMTDAEVCALPEANALIEHIIKQVTAERSMPHYQIPKAIHLEPTPFAVENGLLTPTFKLKRNVAKVHYATALEGMRQHVLATMPQ
eukprot:TRINITY_DN5985_c0_g1_i1.p1 TRINITY_DN5985_c0_g1~~TRINITY_DN5985_c0_g1_i1.p1  ORF type:complete len:680 (+),score=159.46 TRINITY_DN5985_c0_g1_i1:51-2042(+)